MSDMSSPATPPPSAAHRGPHAASPESELTRRFLVGAAVVIGAAAAVSGVAGRTRLDEGRAEDMARVLDATAALCALSVFALCRATWRQIGDRAAVWAGAAALSFGLAAASRVTTVLVDSTGAREWLEAVSAAGASLTPVLFAAGLVPALLRRRLSPGPVAAATVAGVAVVAVVMRAAPGSGRALTVVGLTRGDSAAGVVVSLVVAVAWLALAVAYTVRGFRMRWLYGWAGLMLFALTLAGLTGGVADEPDGWYVGAAARAALGAVIALVGCYLDLTRVYEDQTLQLSDSEIEVEAAEARERVRIAAQRTQRHDLINAITAIDGAAGILEREFERLSDHDREQLAQVLGSGTARLRTLLSQETTVENQVSLSQAAATVAKEPAWHQYVETDVTPDLLGVGSPGETAEVVRQLVDYAYCRAPGSAVTLRGERDGDWVVLRVEDRGPTMPRQLRRTIVDPDNRRAPGTDDAMGLRVAARLMRGQGGDLWVEARPGGGSSFGICLPALPPTDGLSGDGETGART